MEKLFFLKCRTVGKCERAGRWRGIKRRNIWLSRLAAAWKCMTYQARLHCQCKTLQTRRALSSESHSSALLINSLWELNYIRSNLHRHTLEPAGGRTRYCSWCSWCWWCWDVHEDDGQMTNETLSFCDVMTHRSWFNIIHLMDRKHILGLVLVPTVLYFLNLLMWWKSWGTEEILFHFSVCCLVMKWVFDSQWCDWIRASCWWVGAPVGGSISRYLDLYLWRTCHWAEWSLKQVSRNFSTSINIIMIYFLQSSHRSCIAPETRRVSGSALISISNSNLHMCSSSHVCITSQSVSSHILTSILFLTQAANGSKCCGKL